MPALPSIVCIDAEDTYDLRRRVLRIGTASSSVDFPEDDLADTIHLGVEVGGDLVAISTWINRRWRHDLSSNAIQLRGMATEPAMRGTGIGLLLLRAGLERARSGGADIVWANARITALAFYVGRGFATHGSQFATAETGIAHQEILLRFE